jgi:trans-2-enoyl-CoA reductase
VKVVHLVAYGKPADAVVCVDVADAPPPGPGEVRFEVEAFPTNPEDVLLAEGKYAARPSVPALLGAECVGRVTTVGQGIEDLAIFAQTAAKVQ